MSEEKAGVDERYSRANNTSDLTVKAERGGAGDVLIAAGWSPSRLGTALLRLHSEWDAAEKPRALHDLEIKTLAEQLARGQKVTEDHYTKAREEAQRWFLHEQKLLLGKLKTLPSVREQLALKATEMGFDEPMEVAAKALMWWLDSTCRVCHGRRWERRPGTPTLSSRACRECHGSGVRMSGLFLPLVNYIEDCVNAGRDSIKSRLRGMVQRGSSTRTIGT